MNITWLTLDIEHIEGEEKSFSLEYVTDKRTHQISFYFPWFIVSSKIRIE